jgi:hypothetical protein
MSVKISSFVTIFAMTFHSCAAYGEFFYRGTSVYLSPVAGGTYNHTTAVGGPAAGGELGLDHEVAGSSLYLSGFARSTADLVAKRPRPDLAWGGGLGLEFANSGTRFTFGFARDSADRRGGYIKATQKVWQVGVYTLALDSQYQRLVGKNDEVSEVVVGISNHFGKFCGGQVVVVTAAIAVVSALAYSARSSCYGCGNFDFNWLKDTGC